MLALRRAPQYLGRWQQIRTHIGHGNPDLVSAPPPDESGPRQPLQLGLESAKASQNILRLLESSHGVGFHCADTLSSVWHPRGSLWKNNEGTGWVPSTLKKALEKLQESRTPVEKTMLAPSLLSLTLSDSRTALAKISGVDGRQRYVSLLRLDPSPSEQRTMSPMVANDGWHIVREVIGGDALTHSAPNNSFASINDALNKYLSIEHGGGSDDKVAALNLFAEGASLLSVGIAPSDESSTDWSAPTGSLLEIPLKTYSDGVASQTPHLSESKAYDAVASIDVLSCQTAASATVHVGNGSKTNVFVDHILLGRSNAKSDEWRILSKVFTPRSWPQSD